MNHKRWVILSALLFGFSLVMGLTTPSFSQVLLAEDVVALEDLSGLLSTLPQSSIMTIILVKNLFALLVSFVLSPFLLLVPLIALVLNGWLLGFISAGVLQERSFGFLVFAILPHGFFEIPALIIGEAVAFSFGTAVILSLFSHQRRAQLLPSLRKNLKYLAVALILLIPAAVIETYLTPLLLK
jgi:stage II sporulation protein M